MALRSACKTFTEYLNSFLGGWALYSRWAGNTRLLLVRERLDYGNRSGARIFRNPDYSQNGWQKHWPWEYESPSLEIQHFHTTSLWLQGFAVTIDLPSQPVHWNYTQMNWWYKIKKNIKILIIIRLFHFFLLLHYLVIKKPTRQPGIKRWELWGSIPWLHSPNIQL